MQFLSFNAATKLKQCTEFLLCVTVVRTHRTLANGQKLRRERETSGKERRPNRKREEKGATKHEGELGNGGRERF